MIDNIKFDGVNRGNFNRSNRTKNASTSSASSSGEQINISENVQSIIDQLISEPEPVLDLAKIEQIKNMLSQSDYDIDHKQVANDLLVDYFVVNGQGHDDE